MKALRIHAKRDLRIDDLPTPEPGPGQVRLRISHVGVCGSDLHYYEHAAIGTSPLREPLIPGHEVSGTVDLDPSGRWAPGTPVTVHPATFGDCLPGLEALPHLWPNGAYLGSARTWPHTQGGMSEFLLVRDDMVRPLPDGLDVRLAALAEPLAVSLHGIVVAGGVEGRRVLVGGSGPIGLLAAAGALASGAASVTCSDLRPAALERARALGVHHTLDIRSEQVPANAYDVVLECSGTVPGLHTAIGAVRPAGIVAQLGLLPGGPQSVDLSSLMIKEGQLRGCFRFNDEIESAMTMLRDHPAMFEQVISHEVGADEGAAAFAVAREPEASKVLVRMWGEPA